MATPLHSSCVLITDGLRLIEMEAWSNLQKSFLTAPPLPKPALMNPSFLSGLDISNIHPNSTASSLCPQCSGQAPTPDPALSDALREAQERVNELEQELQKYKGTARKRLEKAKEKSVRIYNENVRLGNEVEELKDRLKEVDGRNKEFEALLAIAKKQIMQQRKESPAQNRAKTPDRTTSRTSTAKEQHYLLKDRLAYVGEMVNSVPHGKGRLFFKVGAVYQGEFSRHKIEGFGIMRNLVTDQFYQGQWKNGKRHGKGLKILGNVRYEGEFRDDVAEGYGEGIDLKTGKKYAGQWHKDRFQGESSHDSLIFNH